MDILRLKNKDIKDLERKTVLGIVIAEPGAMGDPGGFDIICEKDGGIVIYKNNYVYGNFDSDAFLKHMRLSELQLGDEQNIPKGWKWLYFGAGNHMVVRKKLGKLICDKYGGTHRGAAYVNRFIDAEEYVTTGKLSPWDENQDY